MKLKFLCLTILSSLLFGLSISEAQASTTSSKGNGFHRVGSDISPGLWRSNGNQTGCYWARLDANQNLLGNHFGQAGGSVNIRAGDFEVEFDDCGTWTFVENEEKILQSNAANNKGNGFYTVGVEIAPGRWRSTSGSTDCYWARLDRNQDIVDNHFGQSGGTVTIDASDYEVEFSDCGTWTYQDAAPAPNPPSSSPPASPAPPAAGQPCPPSGVWPPGCVPGGGGGGNPAPPPAAGQPCPTSGVWPAGCIPGGGGGSPAPAPAPGQPCPPSGPWPAGCVPNGGGGAPAPAPNPGPGPAPAPPAPPAPPANPGNTTIIANEGQYLTGLSVVGGGTHTMDVLVHYRANNPEEFVPLMFVYDPVNCFDYCEELSSGEQFFPIKGSASISSSQYPLASEGSLSVEVAIDNLFCAFNPDTDVLGVGVFNAYDFIFNGSDEIPLAGIMFVEADKQWCK